MTAEGASTVISCGSDTNGMAMKRRMYSMLAMFPIATWIVDPVMNSRLSPKYQSITVLSFPSENWRGMVRVFFLVPVFIRREALGQ